MSDTPGTGSAAGRGDDRVSTAAVDGGLWRDSDDGGYTPYTWGWTMLLPVFKVTCAKATARLNPTPRNRVRGRAPLVGQRAGAGGGSCSGIIALLRPETKIWRSPRRPDRVISQEVSERVPP